MSLLLHSYLITYFRIYCIVAVSIIVFEKWRFLLTLQMRHYILRFLPRCMHCMHRGLATRKLSVRLSVCQTHGL